MLRYHVRILCISLSLDSSSSSSSRPATTIMICNGSLLPGASQDGSALDAVRSNLTQECQRLPPQGKLRCRDTNADGCRHTHEKFDYGWLHWVCLQYGRFSSLEPKRHTEDCNSQCLHTSERMPLVCTSVHVHTHPKSIKRMLARTQHRNRHNILTLLLGARACHLKTCYASPSTQRTKNMQSIDHHHHVWVSLMLPPFGGTQPTIAPPSWCNHSSHHRSDHRGFSSSLAKCQAASVLQNASTCEFVAIYIIWLKGSILSCLQACLTHRSFFTFHHEVSRP